MKEFSQQVQNNLDKMITTGNLFRSSISGNEVWDLYLSSFNEEDNPVFRDPSSSSHNCNHCKNTIRRYGNIVAVDSDFNLITIWDVDTEGEYKKSADAVKKAIIESSIENVFFETFDELQSLPYEKCTKTSSVFQLGVASNTKRYTKEEAEKFGVVKPNEIKKFDHLHLMIPSQFVDKTGKSIESIMASHRDNYNVFKRAMDEIPLVTLELVRDLINQGSLLDGATHLHKIEKIIPLKKEYDDVPNNLRDNWCWVKSHNFQFAKFKNELIGVLCTELAEGIDINLACKTWNKRVDPANYMKATAPITKKQIDEAKKFVQENGYEASFNRRFAVLDDIKASEIKHMNSGDGTIEEVSIFDSVKSTASHQHKRNQFDNVEEVSIDKFMKDILPSCTSVEAFLVNKHEGNMVTMTTSASDDSKPIFKWDNNYSWTFNGNLAGKSQLAEMVEAKGGRIDGAFRFTHSWNELERNQSLMDLHVFMPGCQVPTKGGGPSVVGRRVGWNCRQDAASGGIQDVDCTAPAPSGYIPVENITFPSVSKMPEGVYVCKIHNWSFRSTGGRGKAEIAFGNEVYQYEYPATRHHEWVTIAEITLSNGVFTIDHKIPPVGQVSKEIYGLDTNKFHKVNLVCLSPNHWGTNKVGNKFYFFMLEGAKTTESIRSFHNENLNSELASHRKVMEVLGNTNLISPSDKQLSGLGFNASVKDELIVKLTGNFKRVIKIKF